MTPVPNSSGRTLQYLLQTYPQQQNSDAATLGDDRLRAVLLDAYTGSKPKKPLYEIASAAAQSAAEPVVLAEDHGAILQWLDATFERLAAAPLLDPELETHVQGMLPVIAALAISDRDFLMLGQHPLHKMLDLLYKRGIGWHSGLGRSGKVITDKLDELQSAMRSQFGDDARDLAQLSTELDQFFEREVAAFGRLRDRLIATEQGRLKANSARQTVAEAINQLMAGCEFPIQVAEFLQGPWFDSMQLGLIKHGHDGAMWQRLLKITETLVWTVQPTEAISDARRQRLYKIIPQLPRELHELLVSLENNSAEKDRVVGQIEEIHFQILRKQKLNRVAVEPITLGQAKVRTKVADQLVEQVKPLQQGQWFRLTTEQDEQSRICLALKLDEYQQMLFVNRAGARAMQKTFEEFSYLLSSGVAEVLPEGPLFSEVLRACAEFDKPLENAEVGYGKPGKAIIFRKPPTAQAAASDIDDLPELDLERTAADTSPGSGDSESDIDDLPDLDLADSADSNAADLTVAVDELPAPDSLEKTRQSEPVAPASQGTLADQASAPQATAAESPSEDTAGAGAPIYAANRGSKTRAAATSDTEALPKSAAEMAIGCWVRFNDTDGEPAKLAVRVESLDKFIFVDGSGGKKRELKAAQLQLLLDSGRAEALGSRTNFTDAVKDIVADFRSTDEPED